MLAGLLVAARRGRRLGGCAPWPRWLGRRALLAVARAAARARPSLLQLGLRDSTAPWFFTNDSTYQIELGGDLVLTAHNPYGHDYRDSGLERFYTRDGTRAAAVRGPGGRAPALRLLPRHGADARRPGGVLPAPLDDYRLLVLLCDARDAGRRAARSARRCSVRLAARRGARREPARRARGVVREERRAQPALLVLAFALVTPAPLRLGRRDARARRPAEAVRARRAAVPGADALVQADGATALKRAAAVVRRRSCSRASCRS